MTNRLDRRLSLSGRQSSDLVFWGERPQIFKKKYEGVLLRLNFMSIASRNSNWRVQGDRFVKVKLSLVSIVKVANSLIPRFG